MKALHRIGLLLLAAAAAEMHGSMLAAAPAGAPPTVRIERLSPGAVQPQVAMDGHGGWHRIFLQGDPAAADVFYQSRKPTDTNGWRQPVRVNTEPGSAIAADGEGRVFAFWHASGPTVPDGEQHRRVFLSISEDDGAHFKGPLPAWHKPSEGRLGPLFRVFRAFRGS